MNDLVDTTEMYLRTIYDLEEEGVVPLRARIAERLEQSGPTVSQTVSRMERDGLLHVAGDRHLELTEKGRNLAVAVMRKHRLAERLLVDVIGLPIVGNWYVTHLRQKKLSPAAKSFKAFLIEQGGALIDSWA